MPCLFSGLGLCMNLLKAHLEPIQVLHFIEDMIHFPDQKAFLPEYRAVSIQSLAHTVLNVSHSNGRTNSASTRIYGSDNICLALCQITYTAPSTVISVPLYSQCWSIVIHVDGVLACPVIPSLGGSGLQSLFQEVDKMLQSREELLEITSPPM